LDLNNAVNEQIPVKTAVPLEVNDKSYDVTKWVSFAGKQVLFLKMSYQSSDTLLK
jgi:hypothetical protein